MKQVDAFVTNGQRADAPELVVTLDGAQGSGKSLLARVLAGLIPLLGFGQVTVVSRQPE